MSRAAYSNARWRQVWFARSGKPWLHPTPEDVRSTNAGGSTIWLDERDLLVDIEKRLGQAVRSFCVFSGF